MSKPQNDPMPRLTITSAAITDRGLNEKRPLNEDSFLEDSVRGIFAVADGVGGAEAGEVASQTAIEVLDEAFRHGVDGADIEDLMELAIQRANASIHQMAQEHNKFSMMATTVVALYLKDGVATFGHVGDSRLYRLTPAGQLVRETADHSVVEEEVRAGRMTVEQAANHPSKNVISRALGAEDNVEVDMKVTEVEDGTQFLLCTDGITRHIPDHELRQLLIIHGDLTSLCEELKQRCLERGAEDNLTAVLVRVGSHVSADERREDLERTMSPETTPMTAAHSLRDTVEIAHPDPVPSFVPASRVAFPEPPAPAVVAPAPVAVSSINQTVTTPAPKSSGGFVRTLGRLFVLLIFVGAIAGAFYAGRKYRGTIPYFAQNNATVAQASPTPAEPEDWRVWFESERRSVDFDPGGWLVRLPALAGKDGRFTQQDLQAPLASTKPELLYLYGRASLLTGNYEEAARAFEAAIINADGNPSPENSTLKTEATLGLAAVALKSEKDKPNAQQRLDKITLRPAPTSPPGSP